MLVLKIDFHTHGKLAKGLPFSESYTVDLFQEAYEAGLDAICLTEHFNSRGYRDLLAFVRTHGEAIGDCYQVGDLKVFVGMEVDILEVGHVLVIGAINDILAIHEQLECHMSGPKGLEYEPYMSGEFISAASLMTICKQYPVLVGGAHVFREGGSIPSLSKEVLSQFDFFDLNGKDCSMDLLMKEQVLEFARQLGKPVVAGSDTHQSLQYGCIYNVFNEDCVTIEQLKNEIDAGHFEIEMVDYIKFKVKAANTLKKVLKGMYESYGSYVLESKHGA